MNLIPWNQLQFLEMWNSHIQKKDSITLESNLVWEAKFGICELKFLTFELMIKNQENYWDLCIPRL